MKVLTFSWEFPPAKNGGLGVACYGLTRELLQNGLDVTLVLPKTQKTLGTAKFIFADTERLLRTGEIGETFYGPYCESTTSIYSLVEYDETGRPVIVRRSILDEAHRFAHEASLIASQSDCDVIHAHDWTSYLAGVAAKQATGRPLVVHVHATSYDQAGGNNVDPSIKHIEQQGFQAADEIIAVSQFTKNMIVSKHGVDPDRVIVIHNGCDAEPVEPQPPTLAALKAAGRKIVLYHGRISIQKGVDHFIRAARLVVDADPSVLFVISGSGDMERQIMHQVGELGLSEHVRFAGALWDTDRDRMYQAADLFVMPSVSEPFGLVPLEALQHGTPSVITKQSGVGEVLPQALRVDFWDHEAMAARIIEVLRYPVLKEQLVSEGRAILPWLSWRRAAVKVEGLFRRLLQYA